MIRKTTLAALAIQTVAATLPSAAGSPAQVTVSYRDLNFADRAGAHILLARIDRAATTVCGGNPDKERYTSDTPVLQREFDKCHTAAVLSAVNTVNAPLLLQAYAEGRGATPMRVVGH